MMLQQREAPVFASTPLQLLVRLSWFVWGQVSGEWAVLALQLAQTPAKTTPELQYFGEYAGRHRWDGQRGAMQMLPVVRPPRRLELQYFEEYAGRRRWDEQHGAVQMLPAVRSPRLRPRLVCHGA